MQQLLQLELRGIALLKRGNPAKPWTMVRPVTSFTVNAPTLAILGPYRNMGVMISPPGLHQPFYVVAVAYDLVIDGDPGSVQRGFG